METLEQVEVKKIKRTPPAPLLPMNLRHLAASIPPISIRDYAFTDIGYMEFFETLMEKAIRYNTTSDKWLIWQGHYWAEDKKKTKIQALAIYAAKLVMYQAKMIQTDGDEDPNKNFKKTAIGFADQLQSKAKLETIKDMATLSTVLATDEQEWNQDGSLLAVKNGVIELPTKEKNFVKRDGRQTDMLSRFLPVAFDANADCPIFKKFLPESIPEDETRHFVQKALGYSLTGDISEQVVFFCVGEGNNGKSVLLSTISRVIGQYADRLDLACLDDANANNIPNDIAALAGKRFIVGAETRQGGSARFNEAKMKMLSGESELRGRFLKKEFFTFNNQVKLWISMNHLPAVTDSSQGYWRRCRPITFPRIIADAHVDKQLENRMKSELPGILNWLLAGCKLWQDEGLEPPKSMLEVVKGYQANSDTFGQFIADCCVFDPEGKMSINDLSTAIAEWCKQNGERIFPQRTRNIYLEKKGCERRRLHDGRYWFGIRPVKVDVLNVS